MLRAGMIGLEPFVEWQRKTLVIDRNKPNQPEKKPLGIYTCLKCSAEIAFPEQIAPPWKSTQYKLLTEQIEGKNQLHELIYIDTRKKRGVLVCSGCAELWHRVT